MLNCNLVGAGSEAAAARPFGLLFQLSVVLAERLHSVHRLTIPSPRGNPKI
jgi:hypothetical protein